MRRDQISLDRQRYLVPAAGHPNVLALVAPPTPRRLPASERFGVDFESAHAALGRLQAAMPLIPDSDIVTRTLARREAVRSSQIEGTKADLPQLFAYEATRGASGLPADVKVTERYVVALQEGLERVRAEKRKALDLRLVNELHASLLRGETAFPVGAYRTDQVWVGPTNRIEDAKFVPAPPVQVPACMEEWAASVLKCAPGDDEHVQLGVVAQLAIVHAQFETIHPFHDGNGRVGRLLMPLLLAAEGYPPLYLSGSLLRSREEYYAGLLAVQLRGEWTPWIRLLTRAVVESCDESIAIAQDLAGIRARWELQLGQFRADSAARRLPAFLLGQPVLSVKQAAAGLGVSLPAANAGIKHLLDGGLLELVEERQWGRIFRAPEILARLDRPPA
jgi:Fic family protein